MPARAPGAGDRPTAMTGDGELRSAFESGELSDGLSHRDHVRLAWLYLHEGPLLGAIERFSCHLKAFARRLGKEGLYSETMTWAYFVLINERRLRRPSRTFDEFAEENADLMTSAPSLLSRYYEDSTLASELARRVFLMPDRVQGPRGQASSSERDADHSLGRS